MIIATFLPPSHSLTRLASAKVSTWKYLSTFIYWWGHSVVAAVAAAVHYMRRCLCDFPQTAAAAQHLQRQLRLTYTTWRGGISNWTRKREIKAIPWLKRGDQDHLQDQVIELGNLSWGICVRTSPPGQLFLSTATEMFPLMMFSHKLAGSRTISSLLCDRSSSPFCGSNYHIYSAC